MVWTWSWWRNRWLESNGHRFVFESVCTTNYISLLIERYSTTENIEYIRISLQGSYHSLINNKTCWNAAAIFVCSWWKIFLMHILHISTFIIIIFNFIWRPRYLSLHYFRSALFGLSIWWFWWHWLLHQDIFIHNFLEWGTSFVVKTDWELFTSLDVTFFRLSSSILMHRWWFSIDFSQQIDIPFSKFRIIGHIQLISSIVIIRRWWTLFILLKERICYWTFFDNRTSAIKFIGYMTLLFWKD